MRKMKTRTAFFLGAAISVMCLGAFARPPHLAVFHHHIADMAKQRGVPLAQAVEAVKSWGIEGIDVFAALDGGESGQILAAGMKPTVYILTADFGKSDDAASVEKAKAFLQANKDCKRLMLVPGFIPEGMTREAAWEAAKPRIARLVDWGAANGVEVGMEDFDSNKIIAGSTGHLREVFRVFPRLGHVLDTGNYAFWGERVEEALREFRGKVMHVHVKDRDAESSRPVPAGSGAMPIAAVVGELVRTGYDGWLTIECFGSTNIWEDVSRAAAYLKGVTDATAKE